MASKFVTPPFVVRLRDKRGRYIRGSLYGQAASFELWLGRKKEIPLKPFPRQVRKASEKREYIKKLLARLTRKAKAAFDKKVRAIERERRRIEREKEAKARKKRAKERKRKAEIRRKRLERERRIRHERALRLTAEAWSKSRKMVKYEADVVAASELVAVENQYPLFDEAFVEKNKYAPPAEVIPVYNESEIFKKINIIEKFVSSRRRKSELNVQVRDYTFRDSKETTEVTYSDDKIEILKRIYPQIRKQFDESEGTDRNWIFRVKYTIEVVNKKTGEVKEYKQGYSLHRRKTKSFESLLARAAATLDGFGEELDKYLTVAYGGTIRITGFSLENIINEEKWR